MVFIDNIEYIGMLCLGAFVGGVLNYGLSKIVDDNSFSKIITTIFGATFSGVIFVFLQYLINISGKTGETKHLYMYPLGLVLALLWAQIPGTLEQRIKSDNKTIKAIGIIHVLALSTLTIYLVWLLFMEKI